MERQNKLIGSLLPLSTLNSNIFSVRNLGVQCIAKIFTWPFDLAEYGLGVTYSTSYGCIHFVYDATLSTIGIEHGFLPEALPAPNSFILKPLPGSDRNLPLYAWIICCNLCWSSSVDMLSAPVPIVLDTTLRDLYTCEGGDEDITLVFVIPVAETQTSAGIPLSMKFTYQTPAYPTKNGDLLAREHLQLMPQAFAFMAGKMPLFMFDLNQDAKEFCVLNSESRRPHQADAYDVFDQFTPLQRPELTFVEKPSDIKLGQDS